MTIQLMNSANPLAGVIVTAAGELYATETERENNVFVQYTATYNATVYDIFLSRNDARFPHKIQGQTGTRMDICSLYFTIDCSTALAGMVQFGVITRIDAVNSDIKYIVTLPLLTGASKAVVVVSLIGSPSQVKADFSEGGTLLHGLTNSTEEAVAAVNTGVLLVCPIKGVTIAPALGDIVIKAAITAGSCVMNAFAFYHCTN